MNRLLLSTSLALALSGSLAFAQQETAPPASMKQHVHNPQRETARLTKRLNLSSDQAARIEPILADRDQKIDALKSDTSISPLILQQQMRAIHQQTKQQLASILTPDQLQQMKSRHHGGTAPQAQPQSNPQAAP
jgi:protein CpxP